MPGRGRGTGGWRWPARRQAGGCCADADLELGADLRVGAFLDVTVASECDELLAENHDDSAVVGIAGRAACPLGEPGTGAFLQDTLGSQKGCVELFLRVRADREAGGRGRQMSDLPRSF
jgi:hypothetical protein